MRPSNSFWGLIQEFGLIFIPFWFPLVLGLVFITFLTALKTRKGIQERVGVYGAGLSILGWLIFLGVLFVRRPDISPW